MVWKVFSNSEEIMEYSQAVISYRKLICPAQQKDFLGLFGGHFGQAVDRDPLLRSSGSWGCSNQGLAPPGTQFSKVKHF